MNYQKIYNQIIERGKTRKLDSYKERHHIIPKCLGGSNSKENLVELTAKEHYICHSILCEIYPENKKLKHALWCMVNKINSPRYKISSRTYERLKLERSALLSELFTGRNKGKTYEEIYGTEKSIEIKEIQSKNMSGENHPYYNVTGSNHPKFGHTQTDKWKEEQSIRMSGENNGMFGKTHSDEFKAKQSRKQKGKGNSFYGRKHSDATKKKLSEINKKQFACKVCGKLVNRLNLIKWHDHNCKKNSLG